jgi:soluble lytic murein transglycosylase-like protein
LPSFLRASGLCAFLLIPLLAGCSAAGNSAATLALAEGAADGATAEEGDAEIVANSLAAEQHADIAHVAAVTPSPRPADDALLVAEEAAEGGAIIASAYAGPAEAQPAALAVAAEPEKAAVAVAETVEAQPVAAGSAELDTLIAQYAAFYEVPISLVRRVVKRESNFNPAARNRIYWGLMQIRHDTAQTMGYRGPAHGLLDAETNLKYAVKYLRGAYITAGGDEDQAVRFYARGYYYDAKAKGLLRAAGLRN